MPFQKGQSGNPGGRSTEKPFLDALRLEITAAGKDHKALRQVAAAFIAKAAEGDVPAIRELADRLDGKVAQPIGNDDTGALVVRIIDGWARPAAGSTE